MHFLDLFLRLLEHFGHVLRNLRVKRLANIKLVLLLIFKPRLLLMQFFDLRLNKLLESLLFIFL